VSEAASQGASARRILANTGFRAVADIGSKLAGLVLYVTMARKLGEASFGVFTYSLAFVALVTTLANLGQQYVLTREVSRSRERVHAYFANTLFLQLALALPALLAATGLQSLFGSSATVQTVVILLGVAIVCEALVSTCFAVFQSFERLGFIPIVLISQRWFTAGVGVLALQLGAEVQVVAVVYLLGALGALSLALYFVIARVARPRLEVDVRRWAPYMRAALPIGIAGVFGTILFRMDITMLGWFKSDATVGLYAAAYKLLETTFFVSWSLGSALYPVFSRLSRGSEPPVGKVLEGGLKLALAVLLPVAVGAMLLAEPALGLVYGESFERGATALVLLGPTFVTFPLAYLSGSVLISQNREKTVAWVYGFVALENVIANLLLIPPLSLDGAALSTSISELLAACVLLPLAVRAAGAVDWRRVLTGPGLATLVAAALMAVLRSDPLAAAAAAAASFALLLFLFERRVYPADYARLRDFLLRRRSATAVVPGAPEPGRLQP
jgi:O-antigen/teichoic acid export membrane protein